MEAHRLTRQQARRIAVRAQALDAVRPADVLEVVRRLTLLQVDPTAAVAPNVDLVAWSRIGSAYAPADTTRALEQDRTLFEFDALVRSMDDVGLHLANAASWPKYPTTGAWLAANDGFRRDILARLGAEGPLLSRQIPDTASVPWASSGWTNNKNVSQMLVCLQMRGEIAISARSGREKLWDLAERVYDQSAVIPSVDEATRIRNERRLSALGIARKRSTPMPIEPVDVGDAGEPAVVEGVKGEWRVDPMLVADILAGDSFDGRTALLSPFDRLIYDRKRSIELFDFDYTLEMYKPAAKRRWGYFALPILHNDQLVGKVDATADRAGSVLRVDAIHEDTPFTAATKRAVRAELADLAKWLKLSDVHLPPA